MPLAPFLTTKVIDSLEALLADIPPAAFVDTNKELGVKYLLALVKWRRDPATIIKRQKNSARTFKARKEKM